MSSLQVNNLTITVNQKVIFNNLSFSLSSGQILGICEPTGSGKSSLLNAIAGILTEKEGGFLTAGEIIRDYHQISYVFQDPSLLENQTVLKNVSLPIEKLFGKKEAESKALTILQMVELESKSNEKACNLSGGEKQRVAIARAFAYPSELLLLDEPFHSQDEKKKEKLIMLTKEIVQTENRMCIIISHDKSDFEKIGARMIVLNTVENGFQL